MTFLDFFRKINYQAKILLLVLFDFFLIVASSFLTEIIYLGYVPLAANALILYIFLYIVIYLILSHLFKVYKQLNRFFGIYYLQNISKVISLVVIFLFVFKIIYDFRYLNINFIVLQNLLFLILVFVSRIFIQKLYFHNSSFNKEKINTIIFGAGFEGINLYRKLQNNSNFNFIAFVDEDINKIGRFADDLQIYSIAGIQLLSKNLKISKCFICIPSASSLKLKELTQLLKSYQIEVIDINKNQISLYNLPNEINGNNKIDNLNYVQKFLQNRNALVTGAAGSIGQEICMQLRNLNVKKIYCLDSNEYGLAKLKKKIESLNLNNFEYALLDLSNKDLVNAFFNTNEVDIVFHAAAHKHVDIVEENIVYSCQNNLKSIINTLDACNQHKIKNFVFISTDKAVRPSNVMGLTKRCGELITYYYSQKEKSNNYCSVRFGNVIGSSGSLLEILRKQIYDGGPVTLTDKMASRYFMTISDAVSLVLKSTALKKNGKILVLNMGKPINIYSLIKSFLKENNLIEKNSNESDQKKSIEIKIIGLRKGEKLHEELFYDENREKCDDMIFSENIGKKFADINLLEFNQKLNQLIKKSSSSEIKIFLKSFADL